MGNVENKTKGKSSPIITGSNNKVGNKNKTYSDGLIKGIIIGVVSGLIVGVILNYMFSWFSYGLIKFWLKQGGALRISPVVMFSKRARWRMGKWASI